MCLLDSIFTTENSFLSKNITVDGSIAQSVVGLTTDQKCLGAIAEWLALQTLDLITILHLKVAEVCFISCV